MSHSTYPSKTLGRILFVALVACGLGLVSFVENTSANAIGDLSSLPLSRSMPASSTSQCLGSNCTITDTTVADFNPGSFFLTGLTKNTSAGGDGDGEVRLQTIGISEQDWNPTSPRNFPSLLGHAAAIQKIGNKEVIFVSGGKDNTNHPDPIDTIYTTTIQSNHSLGTWLTSAITLPVPLWSHGMVALDNTLIVIGGKTPGNIAQSGVYTAHINANGTIGPFHTASPLPVGLADFGLTVVNGTIYVIGGDDPSFHASKYIYYTTPEPISGAIPAWQTASLTLPTESDNSTGIYAKLTAASYDGKIYPIGGTDEVTNFYQYVYIAQPSSNGNINTTPNFSPTLLVGNNIILASSATFGGQIFVAGGAVDNSSTGYNFIFSALITSTGTGELYNPVGVNWQQSPVLSSGRIRSAAVMSSDGWLYVLGGVSSSGAGSAINTYDYGPVSGAHPANYAPYGTYTSPIIDMGGNYTVTNFLWNSTITTSQSMSLTFQYLCGDSSDNLSVCPASTSGASDGFLQTNIITPGIQARYWQYKLNYTRGSVYDESPVLNWVKINYTKPYYPDFTVTGLTASLVPTNVITFTYWVENKESTNAPARRQSLPQSPTLLPSDGFHVSFYADPNPVPATPISLTNSMTCWDTSPLHDSAYPPYIFYNLELYKTPSPFYAQCDVPANTQNYYVQIDTCDPIDTYCTPQGYVMEKDELGLNPIYGDNILGPLTAGGSTGNTGGGGGGNGSYLPYIRKSP